MTHGGGTFHIQTKTFCKIAWATQTPSGSQVFPLPGFHFGSVRVDGYQVFFRKVFCISRLSFLLVIYLLLFLQIVIIPYNLLRLSVSDTLCSRTGLISNQQPFLRRFSAALTLWGLCCLRIAILSLPPFQLWVYNLLVLANLIAWVLWEMSKVRVMKSSYPKSHSPVSLIICFRHYPCFLL